MSDNTKPQARNMAVPGLDVATGDDLSRLYDEIKAHQDAAQECYQKALDPEIEATTGRSPQYWMQRTIVEQNAAILCQGHVNMLGTMLVVMATFGDEDDDGRSTAVDAARKLIS